MKMNLRKASVIGLMLLGTLSLQAQVGRTFVLKNMTSDGVHPNEHGAKELAKAVEAIIRGVRSKK